MDEPVNDDTLTAPFPYFGGKSKISEKVWCALGDVSSYIEPFFGSGAVLLKRPNYDPTAHLETICDKDGFIGNVWRSLQFSPNETARWCDWPVNHCDLSARKKALIKNESCLLENLVSDEKWHDPVMAGYWIWAASCWIGSGLTSIGQRPHVGDSGMGVHKIGKIPHVIDSGKGVQDPYNTNIYSWFRKLSERLRYVRVVCGEWTIVCGGNWQDKSGTVGIFFDPPYGIESRDKSIYHHDSISVAGKVMEWAKDRGSKHSYRIVIAGYEEHKELEKLGWRTERWTAVGGYGNLGKGQGAENRKRETLYFSPHCLNGERQNILFEDSKD